MIVIWGSNSDIVDLGIVNTRPCPTCGMDRPFHLVMHYDYFGFYYIFNMVTKRSYAMQCEVCGAGFEVDKKAVEQDKGKTPVPFMRRFGCLVLAGIVGALVLAIILQTGK